METVIGKAAGDLASVAMRKWFVAMGLAGMIVLVWVLTKGTPHDDVLVGAIGVAMMGFGFGEAECRTFREAVGPSFKITTPVWRLTVAGAIMHMLGLAGLITAILRAIF